jgi:hypothetical protein
MGQWIEGAILGAIIGLVVTFYNWIRGGGC